MKKMVTAKGQVKIGDRLFIAGKNKLCDCIVTVEKVIDCDGEEVIFDIENNRFFNTDMMLAGESWALNVQILDA